MLWNGLFQLHKSRKTDLHKTSLLSLSALCWRWSEHPPSDGEWSLEMRQLWFLMEPLCVQGLWWGARWAPISPSCPLPGSNQTAHRPTAGTFPDQPSQGSQVRGSPPTPRSSKHPSTFHFMSGETGVGRKKQWWSLVKASRSYGHEVV